MPISERRRIMERAPEAVVRFFALENAEGQLDNLVLSRVHERRLGIQLLDQCHANQTAARVVRRVHPVQEQRAAARRGRYGSAAGRFRSPRPVQEMGVVSRWIVCYL